MATKKDESVLTQQKIVSRKEDSSKTHLKLITKKEEPPQAQQKMEESSQVQQKTAGKKEETSKAQQRMVSKRDEREPSQGHQGDAVTAAAPSGPTGATGPSENLNSCGGNSVSSPPAVLKSGPLFLSSKGIGWTSWKKRWFILTHTSLVFFRSDPNVSSQKGNEVNLTLGGIDLNNSGSVVVKADKKLITVQFQDGGDGRTFTLKAETLEDLYEWKAALEKALSQAPSSAFSEGQNGVLGNDQADAVDCFKEPGNDKQPMRSTVLHRPILLALEDVDGAPTFLEKSLRFVEEHGVKVEGILRQAADVEDVERRIREFEQGKTEFSPDEDAHVIADCVKYVIRELPSPPVPASCCNALLEACRTEPSARVNAMRMAVLDTFPEPNRRLLQRILMMMQTVASHKNENRMSSSAVAACMAPLLLRPLLSGDCEIESDFDVGGDGSMQLLKAAAAANHAQTIVITLLEQYDKIFGEGCVSPDLYSDSDETESGSEEEDDDDDDESYEDDECEDDSNSAESGTGSESGHSVRNGDKDSESSNSTSESSKSSDDVKATKKVSSSLNVNDNSKRSEDSSTRQSPGLSAAKPPAVGNGPGYHGRHSAVWGRSSGSKKLATDSIDLPCEEEFAVESLEAEKSDLQKRLTEEIEGNTILEASLEKRKNALHEQRLALEQEVARLEEELQRAREKMIASQGPTSLQAKLDEKTMAGLNDITQPEVDIINLNENVDNLEKQLDQQPASLSDSCNQLDPNHQSKRKDKTKGNEATTTRSRSKKMKVDKAEPEKGKKHESSSQEQSPQNQKLDDSKRDTSSTSKKSATKGEELRGQAANETAGMEKGRGSSQSAKNPDKGKGAEPTKSVKNPEKGRGPDISQ